MIRITFKNLDESELAKQAVFDRLQTTLERFPELEGHRVNVLLSMDNSQFQAGPDMFKVKVLIEGKKYKRIVLEKAAMSLYTALYEVSERLLERLNRFGDKERVKNRTLARKISKKIQNNEQGEVYEENNF